jgi:3-oxoacyl-[acyl-carrier protein] reductase
MNVAPLKHAVVTGGEGGLATALARHLRENAWQVSAPGRGELDVTDPPAIGRFFQGKTIDLLVCAAGSISDQALAMTRPEAWEEIWAVNFTGAAACAAAAIPGMRSAGAGHIVFISSHSALHPPPGQASYAAAKAALLGLTRDLSRRHGPTNLRINAILPGFLETPMTQAVPEKRRAAVLAEHALGRFNTVEAVAGFIHFLHEQLPHTSGQVFQLDSR